LGKELCSGYFVKLEHIISIQISPTTDASLLMISLLPVLPHIASIYMDKKSTSTRPHPTLHQFIWIRGLHPQDYGGQGFMGMVLLFLSYERNAL
jgi:hypothetical protein